GIPPESLLHIAKRREEARHAKNWGIEFGEPRIDVARLRSFKEAVVNKLSGGLGQIAKARKVQYVRGDASFDNSDTIRVKKQAGGEESLSFDRIIVATGSRPSVIPSLKLDSPRMLDSTSALDLQDVPGSLLLLVGGRLGVR